MIALWILLGIFLFFLLLSLVPVGIELHYHENRFSVALRYLFFRFQVIPLPESLKKPPKKPKKITTKPKKAKEPAPKAKKKRPFMDYLQLINDLLPVISSALHRMIGSITVKRCRISLLVAAEDAGDTAIRYGQANTLLYGIYTFLARHIRFKEFRADVRMDYLHGQEAETADADLLLSSRPLTMFTAGIRLLWRGGTIYLDFKNQK